ncbi:fasciclin domain-containing protein [Deinococcus sp.]|uniref:fasciclin domain-containing protein n=1 Tax=Deinococcus sp. TaxID=47478 RepID=UPI003B5C25A9
MRKRTMFLTAALLALPTAIAGGGSMMPPADSIAGIVAGNPDFSTLLSAVQAAGLVETLSGGGPYTVFAPTNAAFAKVPADQLNALLNDPAQLKAVLLYHVVPGKVMAADVVNLTTADTVNGAAINIAVDGSTVKINDATVTQTDIEASNGVIHVIDSVLLPPS